MSAPFTHHPPPARSGGRRRTAALVLATLLVVAAGAVLGHRLWDRDEAAPPPARALAPEEAQRLAEMRQVNWLTGGVGVRATIGGPEQQVHATGWVDWRHPVVYLAVSGRTPGVADQLVQAVPGLIATRTPTTPASAPAAATPTVIDPHPTPPLPPPVDGWQVRPIGTSGPVAAVDSPAALAALATLLHVLASEQPVDSDALTGSSSRWLRRDLAGGHEVDVLLAPATAPTAPAGSHHHATPTEQPVAAMGGAVQYWLDGEARLHRVDALLAADVPARVELDRTDRTALPVLDALGGAAVAPRPPTDEEAQQLAQLRPRNLASGGGEIRVRAVLERGDLSASGWLDWRQPAAYLAVSWPEAPGDSELYWADRHGVAIRAGASPTPHGSPPPDTTVGPSPPPAPPPGTAEQWLREPWPDRGDDEGGYDLDLLVNEVLSLADYTAGDPAQLREQAYWLRDGELGGHPVAVFAIPREVEQDLAPQRARVRYWIGVETGLLHRLELRTRAGSFAQLDIRGGDLPPAGLLPPPA